MTTTSFQAALDRAKAKQLESAFTLTRTFVEQEFTFTFRAGLPGDAITLISAFNKLADANTLANDLEHTVASVAEFMDIMATDETGEHIAVLWREGIIGLPEMVELMGAVIERAGGRPFTSSPSSADGSKVPGTPLTAGAVSEELTPQT
jgi:hypothetical protein